VSSVANDLKVREVISQVVNDPQYKEVSSIPLFSIHQIGLVALSYALVLGGIFLAYSGFSLWLVYPMVIFGVHTSFTPLHDATHRSVSSNKLLNDLIGTISGNLVVPFNNTTMYRYFHLSHHRYVGDKDFDPDEPMVRIPTKHFPAGILVFFIYDVFILKWLFTAKVWRRTPPRTQVIIVASFAANFIFYFVMLTSSVWFEFVIWFVIPNRIGMAFTNYGFSYLPHPEGVHVHKHPFQAAFTLKGNELILRSLWGQADHALHHLLPHIPWYKYKRIWHLANGVFRRQPIPERNVYSPPLPEFKDSLVSAAALSEEAEMVRARVGSIEVVGMNTKSFTFEPCDGNSFPAFTSGSHIDVELPSGLVRSYSLVNPSSERDRYRIAVKKEVSGRGGSIEMHEGIEVGDYLSISVPKNDFVLYEDVEKFVLISGGIGITPLISMAHRLAELEKHFEFHACAKTQEEVPFKFGLENWAFAPHVEVHLDRNGKPSIDLPRVLAGARSDTLLYVCGPPAFSEWVRRSAIELGWESDHIKEESFSVGRCVLTDTKPFEVVLSRRKETISVDENSTIIDALLMNKINVEYSCLQGTCGTCVMNVVEGEVDHRDTFLSNEEKSKGKKMCICVSRAAGNRVVIDL